MFRFEMQMWSASLPVSNTGTDGVRKSIGAQIHNNDLRLVVFCLT